MKKLVAFLLVFTLMMSLAGCAKTETKTETGTGTKTEVTSEPQKITIWAWDPNFNIAIMEEAKARYSAMYSNVTFEIVDMAKADVEQKLLINLSSGATDSLPDIVLIEDYNAQKYLEAYPTSFADLSSSIDHTKFAPYKVQLMTVGGKVYGVPFDSGVAGMYYRSDILEQAGFSADDLNNITWDRFVEIGEVVKEKTGVAMSAFDPTDGGLVRVMLQSAGAWYFDEEGKPFLEGNEALKASLAAYSKIINSDATMKTSGWAEWVGAINSGSAASISTGVWITGSVKSAADQSGKWALAPIPRVDVPGAVNASNLGGSSWYVLDSSKVKATAIDFLNEIYAKDIDFYQKILVDRGAVGSFTPSQSGEAYVNADEFFGGQKVFEEFSAYMQAIPKVEFGQYTYEADAAIAAILPDIFSGKDMDAALKAAQAQLESSIQ
jgi:lactose/L-arabinose transport system substrate-binding protein